MFVQIQQRYTIKRISRCLPALCLSFVLAIAPAFASQLVQVALTDISQLERLQRAGLDICYYSDGGLAEVVLMNQDDRARLNRTGLPYFVTLENIEAFNRSRLSPGRDDMGGFRTFDEIVEEMNRLHEAYPDIIGAPVEIGQSIEERPIWAIKVSDNPDDEEDEPEALFTSLIHCREVVTSYVLFGVIEHLVEGYGNDERLTRLVDERQSWFIPVVNPDGYVFNEEDNPDGGGMWRKNRRRNGGQGGIGVDLNRNFGAHWGYDNVGSSPTGSSETYRGTEAFSEPETQGIRDFVSAHRFKASIFFHSYSNLCLYPYGYDVLQPPDRSVFSALSKRMIANNRYLPGTGWEVIYRTNGDSDDWLYSDDDHDPILAFTLEVGTRDDYFWPPLDRVAPLVAENIEAVLTLIEYADSPNRVLPPKSPQITHASITRDGGLRLRWESPEDEHNQPVSYDIEGRLPGASVVDGGAPDQTRWVNTNFNMSQAERHSGTHSYRAALQSPMSTMTLAEPIVAPDTLKAWLSYNLRSNRSHCIALEASMDGDTWEPLPGNRTQDVVANQRSIGPGIYGISGGWQENYWLLGDYAGKVIKLRFRYYSFNIFPNPPNSEFCYIDDISPMPTYSRIDAIAENVEESGWDGRIENHEQNLFYAVIAKDADGEESFFSIPIPAEERIDQLVLRCVVGWNLVSAPFQAPDPSPLEIFSSWLERESLYMMKDGWGRFFLPQFNYNQIREWSPFAGYYIKMSSADTLVFPGERIPVNSPLPVLDGWNVIGYLPFEPLAVEVALNDIANNLILAKNGYGEFWLVEEGFSNMRVIEPGAALSIKMSESDTLTYPDLPRFAPNFISETASPIEGFIPETPFNMSLLLALPPNNSESSIRLYDREGNYCGGVFVDAGDRRVGLAAWQEDKLGGVGYAEGEPLRAYWHSNDGVESKLEFIGTNRKPIFKTDEFERLEVEMKSSPVPLEMTLSSNPNPFNGRANLRMTISDPADLTLKILDSVGRLVQQFQLGAQKPGVVNFGWDASNCPNGIYFAKLSAGSERFFRTASIKMVLVK